MLEEICIICYDQAKYIRYTQFAGDHPFCEKHAKQEANFMQDDSSTCWDYLDDK